MSQLFMKYGILFSGDCSDRNFDVAILGDKSRSIRPPHLKILRNAINVLVNKLGVSPKGNHFGMILPL